MNYTNVTNFTVGLLFCLLSYLIITHVISLFVIIAYLESIPGTAN